MGSYAFALVAPATRGLSRSDNPNIVREHILAPLQDVDPNRLHLLPLELTSEESIAAAAQALSKAVPKNGKPYLHTAFFSGGVLHPERQPGDLLLKNIHETFGINVISHLLMVKHFSPFLPTSGSLSASPDAPALSKWIHVSARVGSISDNHLGGWYSYRASKAALNQVIRTFDIYLKQKKLPAICFGIHPGTVKTDLSREFWEGVPKDKLFEPSYAAEKVMQVVQGLNEKHRGKVWDWAGKEVPS